MKMLGSRAAGKQENKYKFNEGTELNTDLELNWYETTFRSYDAQIGRFHQIDALYDMNVDWSGYSFVQNNPLLYVDPQGLDTFNVNNIPTDGREFTTADVLVNDDGAITGYWNGEGWHKGYGKLEDVAVTAKKKESSEDGVMGWIHTGLDIVGQIPILGEAADLINGGIYAVQGDFSNAALSMAAMIPIAGNAISGSKLAFKIYQKHHLIPKKVFKTFKKDLEAIGYKRDHLKNLMELPVPFHGNHPAYSAYVKEQVGNILKGSGNKLDMMVDLQKTMRTEIQNIPNSFSTMNSFYKSLGY